MIDDSKVIIPNFFDKEDVEEFLGREITDDLFNKIKQDVEIYLPDKISWIVSDYINENYG